MSLLYAPVATATVSGGTSSIAISGMDLNLIVPGMVINLGARDRVRGDGLIISDVTPSGSSGGTITTAGPVDSTFTSVAFVIDTRDYNGTASNYALAALSQVLNALMKLTSPLTTLFGGSRVLALDKDTSGAISRLMFATAGRVWASLEQRVNRQAETIAIRAYPDGTTPLDSLIVDLNSGGVDYILTKVAMDAGSTVDLGNTNALGVNIIGAARIVSFGSAKSKIRHCLFIAGGSVLVHGSGLSLPGPTEINVSAGDRFTAISDAAGNWAIYNYARSDGTPLALPASPALSGRPSINGRAFYVPTTLAASGNQTSEIKTNEQVVTFVTFTATSERMIGFGSMSFFNRDTNINNGYVYLRLADLTAGGTIVSSSAVGFFVEPSNGQTGPAAVSISADNLTLGHTYQLQLNALKNNNPAATQPITAATTRLDMVMT